MILLVDTREQRPLFEKRVAWIKLNVGDYTTPKHFNRYHIERKSGEDLYGTLTKGNVRFRKELIRAADAEIRLEVLVEISKADFIAKRFKFGAERLFPSEGLRKLITTFEVKYSLRFHWCKSRAAAKRKLVKLLK